jgi:hypothetical protein
MFTVSWDVVPRSMVEVSGNMPLSSTLMMEAAGSIQTTVT